MGRHVHSLLFPRLLAVFLALGLAGEAPAQTSEEPLIVTPGTPENLPHYHGTLGDVASEAGKTLGANIDTLRQNLSIMHDLNSQANQAALNKLGKQYGNIDGLGSNLGVAIASIDTSQFADTGEKLSKNIQGSMDAYGATVGNLTSRLENAVKATPYSASNPPDQAGAINLEAQAKQMATEQVQSAMPVLGVKMDFVMQLSNNLGELNANIVSLNKTYLNLIRLVEQPPSAIIGRSDLPTELATINTIANDQMSTLSNIGVIMGGINSGYSNMDEHKGTLKDNLALINGGMQRLSGMLASSNLQLRYSLGGGGAGGGLVQQGAGQNARE